MSQIYELLFCDRPELYQPNGEAPPTEWQRLLSSGENPAAVQALAQDANVESRVRLLAYGWLRQHRIASSAKEILGVVVEVGLEQGNDTLAAYADGSARYINHSGKLAVFEGAPAEITTKAKELVSASRPTMERIGPWDGPRLPPPQKGHIRLSFLVSDGLYFGEGPINLMASEPLARPVISVATELLQLCVGAVTAEA